MRLRSLLAVALVAPAVAWATPAAGSAQDAGPAPGVSAPAAAAPARRRPRAKKRSQARAGAADRTAPRIVPASGVLRGYSEPAGQRARLGARAEPHTELELGVLAGYEAANVAGLSLRLDGAFPVLDLGPKVWLSAVVSLGYSRLSDRIGFMDLKADVVKLVPAARFTVPLGARFSVFADVGFGVAYVSAHLASANPAAVTVTAPSDRSVNAMARAGVGAWYQATPRLKVGAMAEMDPVFGDFAYAGAAAQNTFLVQGGVMVRL
jgi:hypothetical protein